MATDVADLSDDRKVLSLSTAQLARFNPNSMTTPLFRSRRDAEIATLIYAHAPIFAEATSKTKGAWHAALGTMFHMSSDSELFVPNPGPGLLPLFEAKMFWHFDHRWASFCNQTARLVSNEQKSDPTYLATPRYWIPEEEVEKRLTERRWERKWLLCFRNVSDSRNERTFVAAILPRAGVGNSASISFPRAEDTRLIACLLANFNSLTLDFIARQKIPGMNINYFMVEQFPVLAPSTYNETSLTFIASRVLQLTYTSVDLKPWAADNGFDGAPFSYDPNRRAQVRAELDAYISRLYGLSREHLCYILDPMSVMGEDYPSETFRVLKQSEEREFGEYRTQRLVLAAWDAVESGELH